MCYTNGDEEWTVEERLSIPLCFETTWLLNIAVSCVHWNCVEAITKACGSVFVLYVNWNGKGLFDNGTCPVIETRTRSLLALVSFVIRIVDITLRVMCTKCTSHIGSWFCFSFWKGYFGLRHLWGVSMSSKRRQRIFQSTLPKVLEYFSLQQ
jgi:hypothetical protein